MEENNTELLNSRVVSVDVGEDISDLRSYMKITFLFQNASLVSEECISTSQSTITLSF